MTFLSGNFSNADIRTAADSLAASFPTLVTVQEIGRTGCLVEADDGTPVALTSPLSGTMAGEQMFAFRLTDSTVTGAKPTVIITAATHSRELCSTWVANQYAIDLANGFASDPEIALRLKRLVVYVVPICNPDGRELIRLMDEQGVNLQRRKTVVNQDADAIDAHTWPDTQNNHGGTDINRNFSAGWSSPFDERARSTNEDFWTFGGVAPLDVIESANLATKFAAIVTEASPHPVTLVDLHSPIGVIGWPLSNTTGSQHARHADMARLWGLVGAAGGFTPSEIGQAASVIYPMSGALIDHAVDVSGCRHAALLEMRSGLLSSAATAQGEYEDSTRHALDKVLAMAEAPDTLPLGPEIGGMYAFDPGDGRLVAYGTARHPTAVDAVEVSVGTAPDESGAVRYRAEAAVGSWGDPEVQWVVALPASAWSGGTADVYARGRSGSDRGEIRAFRGSSTAPIPDLTTGLVFASDGPHTFTGSNAVNLGTQGENVTAGPFTLCAVVNASDDEGTIVARRDGNTIQWQLYIASPGRLAMRSNSGWPSTTTSGSATTQINLNEDFWVAGYVNSSGVARFYRRSLASGIETTELGDAGGSAGGFAQQSVDTLVGARYAGAPSLGFTFTGSMAWVRCYSKELNDEERRLLAECQSVPATPSGVSPTIGAQEITTASTTVLDSATRAGRAGGVVSASLTRAASAAQVIRARMAASASSTSLGSSSSAARGSLVGSASATAHAGGATVSRGRLTVTAGLTVWDSSTTVEEQGPQPIEISSASLTRSTSASTVVRGRRASSASVTSSVSSASALRGRGVTSSSLTRAESVSRVGAVRVLQSVSVTAWRSSTTVEGEALRGEIIRLTAQLPRPKALTATASRTIQLTADTGDS